MKKQSEKAKRDARMRPVAEALAAVDAAASSGEIQERGLLVTLAVSRWYGTGNDADVVSEVAERAKSRGFIGSFSKRSMERKHLEAINRVTSEARKYHKRMALPWGDSMERLLSVETYFEYKSKMTAYEHEFNQAVAAFLLLYPDLIGKQKERLGSLFKESDYPSVAALRERFRFRLAVDRLPQADTSDLRLALGAEQAEEIRADMEKRTHDAVAASVRDIYERMMDAVVHVREKLSEHDSIGPKALESLRDVCLLLPKLNLMHDPNISALGTQIMAELGDMDREAVKEDAALRTQTVQKADALLNKMALFKSALQKGA